MLWRAAIFTLFLALNISAESCFLRATTGEKDQPHALVSPEDFLSVVCDDVEVDVDDFNLTSALLAWVENSSPLLVETLLLENSTSPQTQPGVRWHRWCCVELC